MLKKKILILFLLTQVIVGQNLKVNLHIEKRNYLTREPITIIAELYNVGNNEVSILNPSLFPDGGFIVRLFDKQENKYLSRSVLTSEPRSKNRLISLHPQGKQIKEIMLSDMYGNRIEKSLSPLNNYLASGEYELYLEYHVEETNNSQNKNNKKIFFSDKVNIKIDDPTEPNDQFLLNNFDQLLASYKNNLINGCLTNKLRRNKFFDLLKEHPNSAYGKKVLLFLLGATQLNGRNGQEFIDYINEYMTQYPSSFEIFHFIQNESISNKLDKYDDLEFNSKNKKIIDLIKERNLLRKKILKEK